MRIRVAPSKRRRIPPPPHLQSGTGLEMELESALLQKLSSRGILAYVAVSSAGNALASTAALAGLVRVQTWLMLDGLKELAAEAPSVVVKAPKNKWQCGAGGAEIGVRNLDSERYRLFVDDLKKYWDFINPAIPFAMGGADGAAIRQFLNDHREWNQAMWRDALRNRGISVKKHRNGSASESLYKWVRKLGDYAAGPLDTYNRPVEGMGNGKAIAIQHGNRAAVEEFLATDHVGAGA